VRGIGQRKNRKQKRTSCFYVFFISFAHGIVTACSARLQYSSPFRRDQTISGHHGEIARAVTISQGGIACLDRSSFLWAH
jgi:hypothetical protein